MEDSNYCLYCSDPIKPETDNLKCDTCQGHVHVKCLRRPGTPGSFVGDIFFNFTCSYCSTNGSGREVFERQHLPWVMVIVLILYNLSVKFQGSSHRGYFHYRTHIVSFIDRHFECLTGNSTKRRTKWQGTVSSQLSQYSSVFFTSGYEEFQTTGWWKLKEPYTPLKYMEFYRQLKLKRKADIDPQDLFVDVECDDELDEGASTSKQSIQMEVEEKPSSRTLPFMGRTPRQVKQKPGNQATTNPDKDIERLNNFLGDPTDYLFTENEELKNMTNLPNSISLNRSDGDYDKQSDILELPISDTRLDGDDQLYEPRIVQVTNYQEIDQSEQFKTELDSESDEGDDDSITKEPVCLKSLFTVTEPHPLPWLIDDPEPSNEFDVENNSIETIGPMELVNEYEEHEMYRKLKQIIDNCTVDDVIPPTIRRFYRKLCVRRIKRTVGAELFDIDNLEQMKKRNGGHELLDRYSTMVLTSTTVGVQYPTFHARLMGSGQQELFESPHTGRILHPFIYRQSKCLPPFLKLMCELQYKVNKKIPTRSPIDYCYVRPQHIPAVNALLQLLFWPGIDMSECLSYPDFSIIAMYKKLIVGCAFLVPDVGHNEAYVSFMAVRTGWQRAGIATFMLYHLTQTCMGKDITLHVSATNPAVCLYQKFGFKIEEVILDFYDKYLPHNFMQGNRNAFFLRMKR